MFTKTRPKKTGQFCWLEDHPTHHFDSKVRLTRKSFSLRKGGHSMRAKRLRWSADLPLFSCLTQKKTWQNWSLFNKHADKTISKNIEATWLCHGRGFNTAKKRNQIGSNGSSPQTLLKNHLLNQVLFWNLYCDTLTDTAGFLLDHGFWNVSTDNPWETIIAHKSQRVKATRDMFNVTFVLGGFLLTPFYVYQILLMKEILHHLGCIEARKWCDIYHINWCRIFFHQQYVYSMFACKYQKPYHNSKLRLCSQQLLQMSSVNKSLWNSVNYWLVKAGSNSRGFLTISK